MKTYFGVLTLAALLLSAFNSFSQDFWENTYSGMEAQTVRETSDGGFIVCSAEGSDMLIYKLDNLGAVSWKRQLTGFYEGATVKQTLDGGYIAVGRGDSGGTRCLAIAKLDASGITEWGKIQELHNVYDAKDVIQLPDSSFIVCAAGGDNSGYDNSGLLRYDKAGNLLWDKSYRTCLQSGCHPVLNKLLDNGNGEFFAFGEYYTNSSSKSGWIIKFDSLGTVITQAKMAERIYDATKLADGNIVVTGGEGLINDAFMMKIDPSNLSGVWRKSYALTLPFVGASQSYGMSVLENDNAELILYAVTKENMSRCIIIKTNQFGNATEYHGLANFNVGGFNQWGTRLTKTTDNGYVIGYHDRVKKIPENLSSTCGLLTVTVSTSTLSVPSPSLVSPTLYTTDNLLGSTGNILHPNPTVAQACSTFVCSPSTSTDVQSDCSSYTWIDGNTYTSSNNTATHTYVGGASNGCDSIVTLDLTIADVLAPVADNASLSDVNSVCQVTSLSVPTATDACEGSITGTHNASLPISAQGTTIVTWTYDDGNGNSSTQTQNVVIADALAPVPNLGSLSDINSVCEMTSLSAPTATDNCAGTVTATHNVSLPISAQGTTLVTWTYDDGNGNTSTQTQNVVISDAIPPVPNVATLADVNASCEVTSLTAPTATDNCAGTVTAVHNVFFPITASGTTLVTWTYFDGNGNSSTQTQNVVIADVTGPVADVANLNDINSECEVTSLVAPTATDNCAGTVTGTHNATLPISNSGTTLITWTYDDGNGNTTTQSQNIVINDVTAPVVDVANLADVNASCEVTSLTAPTATDNCAGTVSGTHNASLPITNSGTTVITWTYDDGNGNTTTQAQTININDASAPIADLANLSNVTASCEVTSLTAPTATDNCAGSITGTHNASLPITAQGTTVITWTYDDGNGNSTTQTQNVVIQDATGPVADLANLPDINSECEVTPSSPTALDDCAGSITGSADVSFPITTNGTTLVTWSYDDGNGNVTTQTQNVSITPIDNGITQVDGITLSADASGYTYTWLDCDNGYAMIPGEVDQTFIASVNGNYAVVIDNGNCSVTSACMLIDEVSIEEKVSNLVSVYPNPNTGSFEIDLGQKMSETELSIYDSQGRVVVSNTYFDRERIEVQLSGETGIYFVELSFPGEAPQLLRIVKQ